MSKKALVVVDMLNDFAKEDGSLYVPNTKDIIEPIKSKIECARNNSIPIIFVNDAHAKDDVEFKIWPKHCVRGTKGAQIIDELAPRKSDDDGAYIIDKTTYAGFYDTKLENVLAYEEIDEITLVGCVTNICIMYTASGAVLRGYKVVVPKNCVAGLDEESHNFALSQMENILKVQLVSS